MAAYDAFLVELFEYTGKDTLKDLSYEDLSRATNKVCKQIYGAKPTEDQKKEQANIKRKVKMEWKKENETEEGVIKTSMYEEKATEECVVQEPTEVEDEKTYSAEEAMELLGLKEEQIKATIEEMRKEEEEIKKEEEDSARSAYFAEAVEEAKQILEEREKEEQQDPELPCDFAGFHFGPLLEQESVIEHLAAENVALKLANGKLAGLIDGLCLGSSIVLSGLLVVLLLYKFI